VTKYRGHPSVSNVTLRQHCELQTYEHDSDYGEDRRLAAQQAQLFAIVAMLPGADQSPLLLVLVIVRFANFLGFLVMPINSSTGHMMLRLTGLGALFGIFTVPSYLAAWATPHTTADLLFYCIFCIALGLSAPLQALRPSATHIPGLRVEV
jgi:hypothetical protein